METIKSLENIDFDIIYDGFSEAFKEYEVQHSKDELRVMLERRGFVPELSFAAFDEDKIVSFTINGIGIFNGQKTAYDTGTGTIASHRRKGLASMIFQHSVPFLKESGVTQYLLEVLQHNPKAASVYKKQGFEISREFNYFVQNNKNIKLNPKKLRSDYSIKKIDLSHHLKMTSFFEFIPSWQNSFESVSRKLEDFLMLGAFYENHLVGHCIFDPGTGDITQIAVDKKHRKKGIGSNLLKAANRYNKIDSIKLINTDTNCESITKFMQSINMEITGKQYEMIKTI